MSTVAQILPLPYFKDFDASGNPLAFGRVYTYEAGTSNPIATYTDATIEQANPNPVPLNNRGEAQIWVIPGVGYKLIVQDASGNQIRIVDQLYSSSSAGTSPPINTVAIDAEISGTNDNYTVGGQMGPAVGFIDLAATSGAATVTGLQAGTDGQIIIISSLGADLITLSALNGGSLSANQFRMPADLDLVEDNSQAFKYSASLSKWIPL